MLTIQNGDTNTSSVHFGTVVKVECETGFTLEGDGILVCTEKGSWSSHIPFCRKGKIKTIR